MAAWDELKVVIAQLHDEQPGVLIGYPTPRVDEGRVPPFRITLAPWATAAAEELHRQFGADVELAVGVLPYPPGHQPRDQPATGPPPDLLDPQQITVELDGPALVRSGHTLRHALLLHNHSGDDLKITATNGQLTTAVVDPATGEVVGGFAGAQALPLITYRVAPGQTEPIPLLTGTASFVPRLGYTVPPGAWGIQAPLELAPDRRSRHRQLTPVLPLTITA